MVVRYYSSVAPETTLTAGVTNASTSIQVGSTTGFPALTPYTLALDYQGAIQELVEVTSAALTTLTVTRGIDGTSATSHNAGARVRHVSSARDYADSRTHENSTNGVHGLAPGEDLVGTMSVQTLSNKTLNNGGFTGAFSGDGAAMIRSINSNNATATSTAHAFQIGGSTGANLRLDNNEMLAVSNGTPSVLNVQNPGGNALFFNGVTADSVANSVNVNGKVDSNGFSVGRALANTNAFTSKLDSQSFDRFEIGTDGTLLWGPGTTNTDTVLYRDAVNSLNLSAKLFINNNLTVTGAASLGSATNSNNGVAYLPAQTGAVSISFTNLASFTQVVTFPTPFLSIPTMSTNINAGASNQSRWSSRAISITPTQFTMFVYSESATTTSTWSNTSVQWTAVGN